VPVNTGKPRGWFRPETDTAIHTLHGKIIRYNDAHSDHKNLRGTQVTNKEIIRELYQSFASGDVPAVTARFGDDITWTEADGFPLAGTYIGPQAVVENVFMRLSEFSNDWAVVVDRLVADGDTVVVDGRYTWNHKESGEPCEVRMAHVWTLAEGKATAFLQHVDTARVAELIR